MLQDPIPHLEGENLILYRKLTKKRGELRSIYRYLFHHPELIEKVSDLGSLLRFQGTLPKKETLFLTLTTAAKLGSRFTWENHIERAKELEIPHSTLEEIWNNEQIVESPWKELEQLVQSYLKGVKIPNEALFYVIDLYGEKGLCESLILIGFYRMLIDSTKAIDFYKEK